jgi:hypothetical protein
LGIVFFAVISPVALYRRFTGRDAMKRHFDKRAATYRVPRTQSPSRQFERPF